MGRAHEVRKASMEKTAGQKSKLYGMYAKEIYQAAKNGGTTIDGNPALKSVIDRAKRDQIPGDVISRSIDKVNKGITEDYVVNEYELFGPGGSNAIVKCLTDNVNRSLGDLKTVCNKTGYKLTTKGSVSFMYETFSVLGFKQKNEDELMDLLFSNDIDVSDIEQSDNLSIIYGEVTDYNKIKTVLENNYKDIEFEIDEISKISKDKVVLNKEDKEIYDKFINMTEDLEDVSNIYTNVEVN